MNFQLPTQPLRNALMSACMARGELSQEIMTACMGLPVPIDSATACELWAIRLEDAAEVANDRQLAEELCVIAAGLRLTKWPVTPPVTARAVVLDPEAWKAPSCLCPVPPLIFDPVTETHRYGCMIIDMDCLMHAKPLSATTVEARESDLAAALASGDAADKARMARGGK